VSESPTWYDLLGVDRTAGSDEIRAAWRSSIEGLEPGDRRFPSLNKAAEVLLDPAARAAYDARLAPEERVVEEGEAPSTVVGAAARSTAASVEERGRRGVPGWLLAALAVAVAIVAGAAATVYALRGDTDVEESAAAARTAAEEAIVPILSYDFRHLDQDRAAAQSYLTSDYRKVYDQFITGVVEPNVEEVRPVVTVRVVSSGVRRAGTDRVEVVLFFDQETTNKRTSEPIVYQNYATVTMQRVEGQWLVDEVATEG
jgi:Mce-associated membrane protein